MTRLLAALAAVALAVPALAQPKDTPAVAAAKALNGSYSVKEVNFDGKPAPAEIVLAISGVDIKDGVITVRSAKKDDAAKFTLEPAADPKKPGNITLVADGDKSKPGLYKFEKGELTIVFAEKDRPADLAAADGVKKLVLVRKDEPKKEEPKKDPKDK
jgi:uncharacterized protein (TIGR03067 family)